jgi:hypothetical protein
MHEGKRRGWEEGVYQAIRDKLTTDRGRELYTQRKITIEPVFGQIKHNRHIDRFMRRARAAAQSEWRLLAATQPTITSLSSLPLESRRGTARVCISDGRLLPVAWGLTRGTNLVTKGVVWGDGPRS